MRDCSELQELAASIWDTLSEKDAAALYRLDLQIGETEMSARLGALAYGVASGSIDPPSAAVWLARQRPRHISDP
jgi:hypothetical protein